MERPKTTYNHLQPPQKHLQPLANNLKPSRTRYKCHEMSEIRRDNNMSCNTGIEQNIHFPLKSNSPGPLYHWLKSRNEMRDHAKYINRLKELYKMNYQVTKNNKIK